MKKSLTLLFLSLFLSSCALGEDLHKKNAEKIIATLKKEWLAFHNCYENYLQQDGSSSGLVKLNFTLDTKGKTLKAYSKKGFSQKFSQCVDKILLSLHFPIVETGGGKIEISYPMTFPYNK